MNNEKEKFRASLKVIQGGNGKNTSIDIPLEDNKEKDELEKEKKIQKLSYQPSGKKMHAFKDTTEKFHRREGCYSLITLLPLRLFLK